MSHTKTPKWGSGKHCQRVTPLSVSQGQVAFRLLCSVSAAGGVIGHSGAIVKRLERETSARIQVDDAVSPASKERLVHVVGSVQVDRRIRFQNEEEGKSVYVSAAQEGLIRVFERVLAVEPPMEGGVVRCRLLVGPGKVGAVIGEGGKRISTLMKDTGASIKIFSSESLPPCADLSDELLQVTGGSLAVKKALIVVSQYLQQKALQLVKVNGAPSAVALNPSMDMDMNNAKIDDTVNGGVATAVVFRLLCPRNAAGAVIGWKGRKVKALEDETGASVSFSAPDAGHDERIITISALESRESEYSSAQNALIRVFNESISSDGKKVVTARLLIQPNQDGWLNVGGGSNISAIQKATGADLQVLDDKYGPSGASSHERIIQIDGERSSVLNAVLHVSWRLREKMVGKDSTPFFSPKLLNLHPYVKETATITDKLNNCRVSGEVNGFLPHKFTPSQFSNGHCLPTTAGMESPRDLTVENPGFELGSGSKSVEITNIKVEIAVRKDLFGSVYGDDGSNLARLRMISGATVEVKDPCPASDGKVIISGAPDQTRVAQSLLQAFMMAAQ